MKAKGGAAVQVRDRVEVFKSFAEQAWTPERLGFLDAVFSDAIRRSGLGSYRDAPQIMGEPDASEFGREVRCRITTITPEEGCVTVGLVVEGWRWTT